MTDDRLVLLTSPGSLGADGNPYVDLLLDAVRTHDVEVLAFSRRRLLDRPDVVHVHWPEQLVRWREGRLLACLDVVKVLTLLVVARLRGAKLVWTAHNLEPHEQPLPRLSAVYLRLFGALVDVVISLGDGASTALLERHPWLRRHRMVVIPHGHYGGVYGPAPDHGVARQALGLTDDLPVLLLMGQIKRYKGIVGLVEAFVASYSDRAHLLVCGATSDAALAAELTALVGGVSNVTLRLEHVPAADVALLHAAADVVVLPYASASALNSGSAILALSLDRPTVVPRTLAMDDLRASVGADWVWLFDGGPDEALEVALEVARRDGALSEASPDLSALEWGTIGAATARTYQEVSRGLATAPTVRHT